MQTGRGDSMHEALPPRCSPYFPSYCLTTRNSSSCSDAQALLFSRPFAVLKSPRLLAEALMSSSIVWTCSGVSLAGNVLDHRLGVGEVLQEGAAGLVANKDGPGDEEE